MSAESIRHTPTAPSNPVSGTGTGKSFVDRAAEHPAYPCRFSRSHTSTRCRAFSAFRIGGHHMNKEISRSTEKSLRQIANARDLQAVESHAQAPRRRLSHFPSTLDGFTRAQKSRLFLDFHILHTDPAPSHVVSRTSQLFGSHWGYHLAPSHFGTAGHVSPGSRRVVARGPFPDHPFAPGLGRIAPLTQPVAISIFTCNKKAIYPTIGGNAVTANDV